MIKYYCDFCKKEMNLNFAKPDTEIGVTVTKSIAQNNRSTTKIEHICEACNTILIDTLTEIGLEVV